ncbi:hypothetical protein D5086_015562 [Populus alba]|uniref:Uncharacterized protein n=1 Tax=Populus alba TaxID=43335 RepID=A0ACC4BS65_POPAL
MLFLREFLRDASLPTDSHGFQYVVFLGWFTICGICMQNVRSYSLSDRNFIHLNIMVTFAPAYGRLTYFCNNMGDLPGYKLMGALLGSEAVYPVTF